MDKFEKLIKDAVEGFEAPYNPQAWENVSQGLNQAAKPWKWIAGGAAAAVIVTATIFAVNYNTVEVSDEIQNDIVLNTTVNNENDTQFASNQDNSETVNIINDNEISESNDVNSSTEEVEIGNEESTTQSNESNNSSSSTNTSHESTSNNTSGNDSSTNAGNTTSGSDDEGNTETNHQESVRKYNTNFALNHSEVCEGGKIDCVPEEFYGDVIYLWDFGDGTFSKGEIVSHEYAEAGDFKVTLSLKDKNTNKTLSESSEFVEVLALPEVDFTWETTENVIPTVKFINLSEEGDEFLWNITGLTSSSQNEFEYTFRKQGIYDVSMTSTSDNGCSKTVVKKITIEEDYNLLAPTAFTPNGDFRNDYFIPEALKIMDQEFVMTIYDEAGALVYETRNAGEPWDGRYTKDNVPAPDGGYVWIVKLKNSNGEYETYNGQVFIQR